MFAGCAAVDISVTGEEGKRGIGGRGNRRTGERGNRETGKDENGSRFEILFGSLQKVVSVPSSAFPLSLSLSCRIAIHHDTHDFSISSELSLNFRLASHALHARAYAHRRDLKNQRVTGNDRAAKARFFDPRK